MSKRRLLSELSDDEMMSAVVAAYPYDNFWKEDPRIRSVTMIDIVRQLKALERDTTARSWSTSDIAGLYRSLSAEAVAPLLDDLVVDGYLTEGASDLAAGSGEKQWTLTDEARSTSDEQLATLSRQLRTEPLRLEALEPGP